MCVANEDDLGGGSASGIGGVPSMTITAPSVSLDLTNLTIDWAALSAGGITVADPSSLGSLIPDGPVIEELDPDVLDRLLEFETHVAGMYHQVALP